MFAPLKNIATTCPMADIMVQMPRPSKRRNEGVISGPTQNRIIEGPKNTRIIAGTPTTKAISISDRIKVLSTH